jgi:hypothetical protein
MLFVLCLKFLTFIERFVKRYRDILALPVKDFITSLELATVERASESENTSLSLSVQSILTIEIGDKWFEKVQKMISVSNGSLTLRHLNLNKYVNQMEHHHTKSIKGTV